MPPDTLTDHGEPAVSPSRRKLSWPDWITLGALAVGMAGLGLQWLSQREPELLAYRLVTTGKQLLPADPDLPVRILYPASSRRPTSGPASGPASRPCPPVRMDGGDWFKAGPGLAMLEVEIMNRGQKPLWHEAAPECRNVFGPVVLELDPPLQVRYAWVVPCDPQRADQTRFRVEPDEALYWKGHVRCCWRRLARGQSVFLRVLYESRDTCPDVRLSASLGSGPDPEKLDAVVPTDMRKDTLRVLWTYSLVLVALSVVLHRALGAFHARRVEQMDDEFRERGELPPNVRTGFWRAIRSDFIVIMVLIALAVGLLS